MRRYMLICLICGCPMASQASSVVYELVGTVEVMNSAFEDHFDLQGAQFHAVFTFDLTAAPVFIYGPSGGYRGGADYAPTTAHADFTGRPASQSALHFELPDIWVRAQTTNWDVPASSNDNQRFEGRVQNPSATIDPNIRQFQLPNTWFDLGNQNVFPGDALSPLQLENLESAPFTSNYRFVEGMSSSQRSWYRLTEGSIEVQVVPVPAALPLFATAIGLVGWIGWRKGKRGFCAA